MCVAESGWEDDADQFDRVSEWEERSRVHEGPLAAVAKCPGEHRWYPVCLPGAEERGNQTETGDEELRSCGCVCWIVCVKHVCQIQV